MPPTQASCTRTAKPGTMFMLAFQTKPVLRVMSRCCDVNGFHRSLEGDMLKLPVCSTRTAVIMRYPSLSTAPKVALHRGRQAFECMRAKAHHRRRQPRGFESPEQSSCRLSPMRPAIRR